MVGSKYARLNPFANSGLTASPISQEPLRDLGDGTNRSYEPPPVFQNSDPNLHKSSTKHPTRAYQRALSNGAGDNFAYSGADGNFASRPSKGRRTSSSLYKVASSVWSSTRGAVSHFAVPKPAAPWEHEFSEKPGASPPSDSVRYFDRGRQRRRLFVNGSFQWLTSAVLCGAIAAALYGFSTMVTGMTPAMKHVFNALITGLSLCLGITLAQSMKVYAQMLRWRFLAAGYRTLQDFELIMNCDSQTKTFRLLWAGRTRGHWLPNKIQLVAALSLAINLAFQVFTALLGLTYSMDVSSQYVRLTYGNVSIGDVQYIGNDETTADFRNDVNSTQSILAQTAVANQWGITGQDYTVYTTTYDDYFANEQATYTDADQTNYWYRFIDRSPLSFSQTTATLRTVNATATCESFKVTYGGYAGFQTDNTDLIWDVTWVDAQGDNHTWWIDEVATGATTWMANTSSACGPRCIQLYALQSADNTTADVPVPRFWACNSTVALVDNVDEYVDPAQYQIQDLQASILAGGIGWSGVVTEGGIPEQNGLQMVRYPVDSQWSPVGSISEPDMARLVMKFTAGAISALDQNGPRLNVTGYAPAPAQILTVQWNYAGTILAALPVAQALVLLSVVLLANKAIIKDTSHLSTARLLRPIVEKLGDSGCLLTGDEIAEQLGNYRVTYGVRDPGGGADTVRHLDVVDEDEGLGYRRGEMPEGRYDGVYTARSSQDDEEMGLLVVDARGRKTS